VSNIANRRAYLTASHILATSMQPTEEMILEACQTLAAVLSDLSDDPVHIIPLSSEDVYVLADKSPSQDSQKVGGDE
jgi:hypothetical protein